MTRAIERAVLLADRGMFRDMGSGFRDKKEHLGGFDLLTWVLLVAGVFVLIAFIASIVARRDKRRLYNSPRALFRELCRAHQLDGPSCRLLRRLARRQRLAQPARLFLEPRWFDPADAGPELESQRAELAELCKRLFAVGATPSEPPAAAGHRPANAPAVRQAAAPGNAEASVTPSVAPPLEIAAPGRSPGFEPYLID
jgi:hypothetical protein